MDKIIEAIMFAEEKHREQKRWSGEPYIIHPLHVMMLVAEEMNIHRLWHQKKFISDELYEAILISAALHDVIEDCGVKDHVIMERFGVMVCNIVNSLTRSDDIAYDMYIMNVCNGGLAPMLIKKADLFHNSVDSKTGELKKHSKNRADKYKKAMEEISREIDNIFAGRNDD